MPPWRSHLPDCRADRAPGRDPEGRTMLARHGAWVPTYRRGRAPTHAPKPPQPTPASTGIGHRALRGSGSLADLCNADAVDPSLPEHACRCLDQRRAILGRFFLGDFHRTASLPLRGLTLKIANAI